MNQLQTTYNKVNKVIAKRLKDGSLPKEYKLPKLEDFDTSWVEAALKKIDQPDIVFVPLGLTLVQWDKLLKKSCKGLWHSSIWGDDLFKGTGWQISVVSGTDGPNEVSVSKEELDKRGVKLPSAQVYIAQQWQRLELKQKPVDKNSWTMANETSGVALVRVAGVYWYPDSRRMRLYYWRADLRDGYFGVRAEESGSNSSTLGTSSEAPLTSSDLQENTEAVRELTKTLNRVFK